MAQQYIGITLPIRLGNNGMFQQSTSLIEQARSNFKNLILTKKGERVMQPEFGCDLHTILFEQLTDETELALQVAVTNAVERWLPYLEVSNLFIEQNVDNNPHKVAIVVDYIFRNNPNVTDSVSLVVTA